MTRPSLELDFYLGQPRASGVVTSMPLYSVVSRDIVFARSVSKEQAMREIHVHLDGNPDADEFDLAEALSLEFRFVCECCEELARQGLIRRSDV